MDRSCPACDATTFHTVLANRAHEYVIAEQPGVFRYSVVRCTACGLGMVDPEPSDAVLQTFYPADYGCYVPLSKAAVRPSWKHRAARLRYAGESASVLGGIEALAGRCIEAVTGKTVSFSLGLPLSLPKHARMFELGFGSGGWLLTMAALGYRNLSGFDIAANAKQIEAIEAEGIAVTTGDFLNNAYPRDAFDCVRLEHALEHVKDPVRVLAKIHGMLRADGILVMTLPCMDSLSGRISLVHSPNGVEIPRHLYHYGPRSLELVLRRAGFSRIRTKTYGDATSLGATISGVLGERGVHGVPRRVFPMLSPAYKLVCDALGQGELLTTVAQR